MYAFIKGTLAAATPSQVVVETPNFGYSVFIPCSAFGQLPQVGSSIQLYTTFVIREFSQTLYGFLTLQERDLFELLMNITGVGPKLAISLIGHLPLPHLQAAVSKNDLSALCKVPGIGKKTAERLTVELRDKIAQFAACSLAHLPASLPDDPKTQQVQDAMLALINLGYSQNIAQKAIKQSLKELPETADLAALITMALKNV
jgi:holliday junction DNA helicase RuvA